MSKALKKFDIRPSDVIEAAAEITGDWTPHMVALMAQPGFEWRTWCQQPTRMVPILREPLVEYWNTLFRFEQERLKLTLQYFLNVDERVRYEPSKRNPELMCKAQGEVAAHFANIAPGTLHPVDTYALCLWMWEILFGDEDWHRDFERPAAQSPAEVVR